MKCIVVFSFSGASTPDPLTRGSAPGPRWGHSSQTPIIGSRYRARHSLPPNAKKTPPMSEAYVAAYYSGPLSAYATQMTDVIKRRSECLSQIVKECVNY